MECRLRYISEQIQESKHDTIDEFEGSILQDDRVRGGEIESESPGPRADEEDEQT